jgi:hypothetical protein
MEAKKLRLTRKINVSLVANYSKKLISLLLLILEKI